MAKSYAQGELEPPLLLVLTLTRGTAVPSAGWLLQRACEKCDYNLSHKILSYPDFLTALPAQKCLMIDWRLQWE